MRRRRRPLARNVGENVVDDMLVDGLVHDEILTNETAACARATTVARHCAHATRTSTTATTRSSVPRCERWRIDARVVDVGVTRLA